MKFSNVRPVHYYDSLPCKAPTRDFRDPEFNSVAGVCDESKKKLKSRGGAGPVGFSLSPQRFLAIAVASALAFLSIALYLYHVKMQHTLKDMQAKFANVQHKYQRSVEDTRLARSQLEEARLGRDTCQTRLDQQSSSMKKIGETTMGCLERVSNCTSHLNSLESKLTEARKKLEQEMIPLKEHVAHVHATQKELREWQERALRLQEDLTTQSGTITVSEELIQKAIRAAGGDES